MRLPKVISIFVAGLLLCGPLTAGDLGPVNLILHYADDTGDTDGARRLAEFYGRNLPDDRELYTALAAHLAAGTWKNLRENVGKHTAAFGFTAPRPVNASIVETFAAAIVSGLAPANLKVRSELAATYTQLLPKEDLFPWMAAQMDAIRDSENKRVSLLKRGQMIADEASSRMNALSTGQVVENRYDALKKAQATTDASLQRIAEARSKLEEERNRGLAMVNESYDYPDGGKLIQAFIVEVGRRVRGETAP